MDMTRRAAAEFFGTFWLTFAGCGAAVLAAGFPALGIGFLGVAFAFGLTVHASPRRFLVTVSLLSRFSFASVAKMIQRCLTGASCRLRSAAMCDAAQRG